MKTRKKPATQRPKKNELERRIKIALRLIPKRYVHGREMKNRLTLILGKLQDEPEESVWWLQHMLDVGLFNLIPETSKYPWAAKLAKLFEKDIEEI